MTYDEDIERRKKAAKEKRKELYQRAKQRKKEYEAEIKRKIETGEMEVPAAWVERERIKNERKAEAKRKRKEAYQAQKKQQLNKKEAERDAKRTDDDQLWNHIVSADELENLKELVKKRQHLRIVKQDPLNS